VTETTTRDTAFRFFQDIAEDLTRGQLVFPTFLQASASVREALTRSDWSSTELAQLVSREPLLCARVVSLANSTAHNPSGAEIIDVKSACMRVGRRAIRSLAATLLVEQAARSKEPGFFSVQARDIWEHSLAVAVIGFVLAQHTGRVSADEAMFAGLVHDLGHFYLYWRATQFEALAGEPERIRELAHDWHAAIGHQLMLDMNLPAGLAIACEEHENDPGTLVPGSLSELLCVANLCSMAHAGTVVDERTDEKDSGRLSVARARDLLRQNSATVASLFSALMGAGAPSS